MRAWTLEPDDVVALPVDDLALRVLQDARDNNEWNWRNWMLLAQQEAYRGRPDALQALMEAWAWLINRGLVVREINQSSTESIVVSRQGHEALERGLPWLRAVQRLDVQLVPELEAKARPQFLRGDFEAAAFMAMKEVEVRVRSMGSLPASLVGVALMQQALRPPRGRSSRRRSASRTALECGYPRSGPNASNFFAAFRTATRSVAGSCRSSASACGSNKRRSMASPSI